jgi:hypothetical protein
MVAPKRCWAVLAVALLATGPGCGGKGKLVPVEGLVKLDGKPVAGATVCFLPDGEGRSANGLTGSDGVFRLTTLTTGDGAAPGSYKVLITKEALVDSAGKTIDPADPQYYAKMMKVAAAANHKPLIPAIYGESKSPLRCQVPPPDGKVVFDLKSTGGS